MTMIDLGYANKCFLSSGSISMPKNETRVRVLYVSVKALCENLHKCNNSHTLHGFAEIRHAIY